MDPKIQGSEEAHRPSPAAERHATHIRLVKPISEDNSPPVPERSADVSEEFMAVVKLVKEAMAERERLQKELETQHRESLAERARWYELLERTRREHGRALDQANEIVLAREAMAQARSAQLQQRLDEVLLIALELAATRPGRRRRKAIAERIMQLHDAATASR